MPANDYLASKKAPTKKLKTADPPDPRMKNLMVVPYCADLLYTTKTPYWMANLKVGQKDINITDGRVKLADKIIQEV